MQNDCQIETSLNEYSLSTQVEQIPPKWINDVRPSSFTVARPTSRRKHNVTLTCFISNNNDRDFCNKQ